LEKPIKPEVLLAQLLGHNGSGGVASGQWPVASD